MQDLPQNSKPKWLRKLERESWQAELIISGLAIIGSLQLPGLLESAEYYVLLNYDRDTLFICYIAFIYWKIFVTGVIILFVFHFIVRALWIGLVGLNSVYPGGFKANKRYSQHFQDSLKEEYGDIDGFINRLDRLGSGVFGLGFGVSGVFFNFGSIGIVVIILHSFLVGKGVDPGTIKIGLIFLFVPVFLVSVVSMVLHSERFRDGKLARKYQWPITKIFAKVTYPVAGRYIATANNLVSSYYIDKKGLLLYFLLGMFIVFVFGVGTGLSDPNIGFFIDKVYHRMADDSTRVINKYEDEQGYEGIYYRPIFDTEDVIKSGDLSVWIPLPERETHVMLSNCSLPEVADTLVRNEERVQLRLRMLECAREYMYVAVNHREVTDYSIKRQYFVNEAGEQFGVRIHLSNLYLRLGENLLEVTTQYPHEESGEPRRTYTPFYVGENDL